MSAAIDHDALARTLTRLNGAMIGGCAGGLELDHVSDDGIVTVKLLGMCGGCSCRALTIGATIRPAIEAVPGVLRLEVPNSGMSRYAEERIARAFAGKNTCRIPAQ